MGCYYNSSSLTQWVETHLKEIGWEGVEKYIWLRIGLSCRFL
jgi:hypothetical protein